MSEYVALLRGINLGGQRKLAMAELRELLSGLGFAGVRTHLNSGNAVFTSPPAEPAALASRIESGIEAQLGMSVRCLIRTGGELRAVIEGNPLREVATNGSRLMVHFLFATLDPGLLRAHNPVELAPTQVGLGDRVIYQWCPDGLMAAPPVSGYAEKHLQATITTRNWNTVSKLDAMVNG